MTPRQKVWVRNGVALLLIGSTYAMARRREASGAERAVLAARYRFTTDHLPEAAGVPQKSIRHVHPALEHYAAWFSSVGAGVAVADLDGDGVPNDLCHVDPRTDTVMVFPVPGTSARYAPRVLTPAPLPFDAATTAPMGCVPSDLDEDGAMDVLVYYWGRTPIAFLRRGEGYLPTEVAPTGARWFTNALTTADLDGDGHLDLVVGNYFHDGSRILDTHATEPAQMHESFAFAFNGGPTHILRWVGRADGDAGVRYEDVSGVLDHDIAGGWTLAAGAADIDGDLLPEIYLAHDFGPDRLLHNRSTPGHIRFGLVEGRRGLATPASAVLGRDSFKGMGVDFADLNHDAVPDIFVSNITAPLGLREGQFAFVSEGDPALMRSGRSPYVERSTALGLEEASWCWDAKLADLDNDGVPEALQACGFVRGTTNRWPELQEVAASNDLLVGRPAVWPRMQAGDDIAGHQTNPFYAWDGARYVNIAQEVGLGEQHVSRGIALADVDEDGDLDFAVANQWEPSDFHRNDCPNCGAYLGLHLRLPLAPGAATRVTDGHDGAAQGRPAVGAAASIVLPDGRRLVAQVDGGNGHSGRRSPDVHFGLGRVAADADLPVEVRWRDGAGRVHREAFRLRPGWHTIQLAWPAEGNGAA